MEIDVEQLARTLGEMLLARGWHVTCAESCTGGGIGAAITAIAGSSDWFGAGFITYSNAAKQQFLGVPEDTLASHGAVSQPVVEAMARGALDRAGADMAVAVSGIAGPGGGTPGKPVGTVWIAVATHQDTVAQCRHFTGDRARVRSLTVEAALESLIQQAKNTV